MDGQGAVKKPSVDRRGGQVQLKLENTEKRVISEGATCPTLTEGSGLQGEWGRRDRRA